MNDLVDWPAFSVGAGLSFVGIVQLIRQLSARVAWDREGPEAKRYRRSENPRAYWSIIGMYALMTAVGFGLFLYSFWGLQP